MSFKLIVLIGILNIIFESGHYLYADDRSESMNSYFKSLGIEVKKENHDSWFSADKGYHVMGGMISTALVGQISLRGFDNSLKKSKTIGASATFTLGLVKEIYDSKQPNNYFSWKDLAANGVGVIIGIILLGIN